MQMNQTFKELLLMWVQYQWALMHQIMISNCTKVVFMILPIAHLTNLTMEFWLLAMAMKEEKITGLSRILGDQVGEIMATSKWPGINKTNVVLLPLPHILLHNYHFVVSVIY